MNNCARSSLHVGRLAAIVVLAAYSVVGCAAGPPKTHAEVIALDVKTGRIVWSSGDLPHIAGVDKPSVDDAAHTVTIVGINERHSPCKANPGVTVALDEQSGRFRSRRDSALPDGPSAPLDASLLVRDSDAQYSYQPD